MSSEIDFSLSQRVSDLQGFRGTVRYIGEVCTSKDKDTVWIGVEFDDPNRGKHDGSVESSEGKRVRYFECSCGGSGSFLKPKMLAKGISLAEALRQNYVDLNAPLVAPGNTLVGQYANTIRGKQKPIELYGENKIRERQQISDLEGCTLREALICRCVNSSDEIPVLSSAKNIISIDLKDNLVNDWSEVVKIGKHFPNLIVLALSGNRMNSLQSNFPFEGSFETLSTLVLNSSSLSSWTEAVALCKNMPRLKELYLSNNNFEDIEKVCGEKDVSYLRGLRVLDLSECGVKAWREVSALKFLKNLESLNLNHNPLSTIGPLDGGDFEGLKDLHIHGCKIEKWADVEELNKLASLRSIRIGFCPLTLPLTTAEARIVVISRLPAIARVNASGVSDRERKEAELYYLRMVKNEALFALRGNSSSRDELEAYLAKAHPQYLRIWKKWGGNGESDFFAKPNSETISSKTILVDLEVFGEGSGQRRPKKKKIPSNIQVAPLKQLCKKLFGIDTDMQNLYHIASGDGGVEVAIELDDDSRPVNYYSVENGSKIYVKMQ